MSQRTRILTICVIAFLSWAIIATAAATYYYREYSSAMQRYNEYYVKYTSLRGEVIQVSVTINYGNGTSVKEIAYLSPNTTVLDALKATAKVNTTYYPAYQASLVDAINGVANNANGNNRWWEFWVNGELALVSADHYQPHEGDSVEWKY